MSIYGTLVEAKLSKTTNGTGYPVTDKQLGGVCIGIYHTNKFTDEEVLEHLEKDLPIMKKNLKDHVMNEFIPWLRGKKTEISDQDIFKQMMLYEVNYSYGHFVDKTSPTGKEGNFGMFELDFVAKNNSKIADTILRQPAAIEIVIFDGKSKKFSCHDI